MSHREGDLFAAADGERRPGDRTSNETTYVQVAIPVPVRRLFTYSVPTALAAGATVGSRVQVSFGPRRVEGTIVALGAGADADPSKIKPLQALVDDPRRLPGNVLALTEFVADYYLCSRGDAIETALPPDPGPRPPRRRIRRPPGAQPPAERARAQRALWARLADEGSLFWDTLDPSERRAAQALLRAGTLQIDELIEEAALAPEVTRQADAAPEPTTGQRRVLEQLQPAIAAGGFAPFLLFGATGSGKTEVYFRAAQLALERGKGVIYLVPEIGLTPLLITKVERRFPGQAAVLHSNLPKRERFEAWRRLRDGACRFAVGTRSAIFAPLQQLGLIIVDEEQDGSYKQEETPRYNARDLAVVRARTAGAAVLLGSATPSLESFHHAANGRYGRLDLGGRIDDRPLPQVEFVDMREEYARCGEIRPISRKLIYALEACLKRGEQAMVLRNRRGWSVALLCTRCGNRIECPRCSVTLTWHQSDQRLRCHYCDASQRRPSACPTCGNEELELTGQGSEQVEALLEESLPGARIARMDRDTIRRKGAHETLLRRFGRHEIDILVGTQMIAKGHDFHGVTLVGVLSADQALGIPDFRASERTFQLITQVAGRAGRGERPGRVVVQAFDPDHAVLRHAAAHDYEGFYEREVPYRRALRYPPLTGMVRLVVSDADPYRAREWADRVAEVLRAVGGGRLAVLGPAPPPLARLRGKSREQVLVRSRGRRRMVDAVASMLQQLEGEVPAKALSVDVDPYSLL